MDRRSFVALAVFNILIGLVLASFLVMMQNLPAFFLGVLFLIFGAALVFKKTLRMLLPAIILLAGIYSYGIVFLGVGENIPEYYRVPLLIGIVIFIAPVWFVIFADYRISKKHGTSFETKQ